MAKTVSVAEAKRRFSDVVGAVRHGGQRFVIERRGTPVAAIVPVDDLVALESKASRGVLGRSGKLAPDVQTEAFAIRWGAVEPDASHEVEVRIVSSREDLRFAV